MRFALMVVKPNGLRVAPPENRDAASSLQNCHPVVATHTLHQTSLSVTTRVLRVAIVIALT